MSKQLEGTMNTANIITGTPCYMAKEVFEGVIFIPFFLSSTLTVPHSSSCASLPHFWTPSLLLFLSPLPLTSRFSHFLTLLPLLQMNMTIRGTQNPLIYLHWESFYLKLQVALRCPMIAYMDEVKEEPNIPVPPPLPRLATPTLFSLFRCADVPRGQPADRLPRP